MIICLSLLDYKHLEGRDHACLFTAVPSYLRTEILNKYLLDEQIRMQGMICFASEIPSSIPKEPGCYYVRETDKYVTVAK